MKHSLAVLVLAPSLVFAISGPASAHGAVYRPPGPPRRAPEYKGPADTNPRSGAARPRSPSGPAGFAPDGPRPGAPPTPPRRPFLPMTLARADAAPDPARWQIWWSHNHDAYLDVRGRLNALATSSEGDVIARQRAALRRKLLAAFESRLESGGPTVVLRQIMVALARLADGQELEVLDRLARFHLAGEHPDLQEAALLAFGVRGDIESLQLLRQILMDTEDGRRAAGQDGPLPVRLRSFAAYAVGLLGRFADSEESRRHSVHALLYALGQESAVDRELRVACVLAAGLIPIRPCLSAEEALDPARQIEELHLCGGAQIDYLAAVVRDARLDEWVRGHAAVSLARLGRGAGSGLPATDDHPAIPSRDDVVRALVQVLREAPAGSPVEEGCVLALGIVADGDGDDVDEDAREILLDRIRHGPPMTQRFALVSLGAVIGRPGDGDEHDEVWKQNLTVLLRQFARASSGRLPWTALALAVASEGRRQSGRSVPASIPDAYRERLFRETDPGEAAGIALSMAVIRAEEASTKKLLRKTFERIEDSAFRTYAAVAAGILGVHEVRPVLEEARAAEDGPLQEYLAASVGLRLLGDADVAPELVKRIQHAETTDERILVVRTLAFLQDPAAGAPLLELLGQAQLEPDVDAWIVWCLGLLADSGSPDWTAAYANDLDYNFTTWTLESPLGDGLGLLDWR